MRIIECDQGTPEWFQARCGIVTARELHKVLAKGEGKTRSKYMRQLAGEIITGEPAYSFQNDHMARGKEQEDTARELLALSVGPISQIGFIRDALRLGCSPDGLLHDPKLCITGGVEIKSCLPDIQIERLIKGDIPSEYRAQVDGSLLVSGYSSWTFFSYSPGMPPLTVDATLSTERRDEIIAELAAFNAELDALVRRVKGFYQQ